ncbi:MAG: hypothetical protein M0R38_09010 [Bacteroidia bacterium]|nr:hypothetical protein [Bacteroidia bacterium]
MTTSKIRTVSKSQPENAYNENNKIVYDHIKDKNCKQITTKQTQTYPSPTLFMTTSKIRTVSKSQLPNKVKDIYFYCL